MAPGLRIALCGGFAAVKNKPHDDCHRAAFQSEALIANAKHLRLPSCGRQAAKTSQSRIVQKLKGSLNENRYDINCENSNEEDNSESSCDFAEDSFLSSALIFTVE